jgi:diguanylate cyclase (GGDEF)-like protein
MGYLNTNGPVYVTEKKYASFFMVLNSMTVFTYLVAYTNYLIRNIIRSETTLRDMANKDRLTGLYNRRYMLEKLEELPDDGSAGVLAMADIDDFKKINDTYGHNAGDEVLKVVSQKMQNACKGCDISRWGGEEFLILCRTDNQSALDMLDNMRKEIGSEPVTAEDSSIKVTITVGMSQRVSGDSIDEWINKTDQKLYFGKKNGKNRTVYE